MIKKIWMTLIAGLLVFNLAACGSNESSNSENNKEKTSTGTKKEENEVKNGPLTEVGQWKEEDGTKVTLKKIATLEKTLDLNPIEMTIQDVKLLELSNESEDENDLLIQISYTTENISDQNVMFRGIKIVTTNTKQQIDVEAERLNSDVGIGEYFGKVKKEGFVSLPYQGESFDSLTTIKLITGDVWNNDKPEKYHESVTEEVKFN